MNSEQFHMLADREVAIKAAGGIDAFRLQALQQLRLKTVIKESHCSPVHQMAFNHTDPSLNNLFATVGKDQATVYDDMHMGDYIGTVVHFVNGETEYAKGGELSCCAWLNSSVTEHPHGEALLAAGCADGSVSVISVAQARVIKMLKGHTRPVSDVAGAAATPGAAVSMSVDGQVRAWDVAAEKCVACVSVPGAKCVAMAADGQSFVVGGARGTIALYRLQPKEVAGADQFGAVLQAQLRFEGAAAADTKEAVECMRFLPDGSLAVRCVNGAMSVNSLQPAAAIASWKLPGCNSLGSAGGTRCAFGTTPDGKFIAAGNHVGDVFVHDAATGKRLATCKAIRVSAPVRACGISQDCRHVLSVLGNGFLFRYEYRRPDAQAEDKENEDANQQQQPMETD